MPSLKNLAPALLTVATLGAAAPAIAADPGQEALEDFRTREVKRPAITNRFFLKESRFELAVLGGLVPNNPFSKRYVGGIDLAYHLSEEFGFEGLISYSPDLGTSDLKGLTSALVIIAQGNSGDFQQPLDKVTLSAAFAARWSPLYGKINLVGETVLNFDLYFVGGIGMLAKQNYFAVYDPNSIVTLEDGAPPNEVEIAPVLGTGMNFFLTQGMALKLDARMSLYIDNKPQYDPTEVITEQRLYNNFVISAGLGFYFPKMKTRLYNF
ncbi:MAG: outer membrane beta-barrel domain-containing protein [Proteobacteria bacterium]|nr:outer membrane beta-barrel domain-containing protein [Pseudomonadota bacterium]